MPSLRRQALVRAREYSILGQAVEARAEPQIWEIEMEGRPREIQCALEEAADRCPRRLRPATALDLPKKPASRWLATRGRHPISLLGIAGHIGGWTLGERRQLPLCWPVPVHPADADATPGYGNTVNVPTTRSQMSRKQACRPSISRPGAIEKKRAEHMPGKEGYRWRSVKKNEAACLARRDDAFAHSSRARTAAGVGQSRESCA